MPVRFALLACGSWRWLLLAAVVAAGGCQSTGGLGDRSTASGGEGGLLSVLAGFRRGHRADDEHKAELQMAVARSFEREGKLDQATKIYLAVARRGCRRAQAYHRLALLHDKQGKGSQAEEYYQAALKEDPRNAAIHCDLGYSYYLRQRMAEAEQSLRKAVALDPEMARAHNNLGLLLARTGRKDAALEEFALANCTEAQARANLAFALTLEEQWDDAAGEYRLALAADPTLATARKGLEALQARLPEAERVGYATANDGQQAAVAQASLETPAPNPIR
jgi:tetratricopeptide (TPR) repeat protein